MSLSRLSALLWVLAAPVARAQTTWYVDVHATPPGNGTPGSPYASIQHAIAQAATLSGDSILVLPGTYVESVDFLGKTLAVRSSQGSLTTILDASSAQGEVSTVQVVSGEGAGTVLESFTLADVDGSAGQFGGAVRCENSSLEIRQCVFRGNSYGFNSAGGAIYGNAAVLTIAGCTFEDNGEFSFSVSGGAIFGQDCQLTVQQCSFLNNEAGIGGALNLTGGSVSIDNCVVRSNLSYDGGGMAISEATLTCQDTIVHGNFAADGVGGGLYLTSTNATLRRCVVSANVAGPLLSGNDHRGGGLFISGGTVLVEDTLLRANSSAGGAGAYVKLGSGTFERCRFEENFATNAGILDAYGAGLLAHAPTLARRCVFWRNVSDSQGPGGSAGGGAFGVQLQHCVLVGNELLGLVLPFAGSAAHDCTLENSVAWSNSTSTGSILGGTSTAAWSDIQGGFPGAGNIAVDPLYWNESTGDFRLHGNSPCINAGNPSSPLDPDGSIADMGAFAFEAGYAGGPIVYCTAKTNSLGCVPAIGHNGSLASVTGGGFVVQAGNVVSQRPGMLIWSLGPASTPFQGGYLCVAPPVKRTPLQSSAGTHAGGDCTGTYWFQWSIAFLASQSLGAGWTLRCQFWSRDPAASFSTGLTDALEFHLYP